MIAITPLLPGETPAPSPGMPSSPAVRIVVTASPLIAGSVKLPVKTAPGARAIVSPADALLIACCRFAPAATAMVAARSGDAPSRRLAHTRIEIRRICIIDRSGEDADADVRGRRLR